MLKMRVLFLHVLKVRVGNAYGESAGSSCA
jgi:hypothetical protein